MCLYKQNANSVRAERSTGAQCVCWENTETGPGSCAWFRPRAPGAGQALSSLLQCAQCDHQVWFSFQLLGTAFPGVLNLTLTFSLPMAQYLLIKNTFVFLSDGYQQWPKGVKEKTKLVPRTATSFFPFHFLTSWFRMV